MPRTSARDLCCQLIQHGCSLSDLLLEITLILVMRYYCGERSYRDTGIIVGASLCAAEDPVQYRNPRRRASAGNENRDKGINYRQIKTIQVVPVTFLHAHLLSGCSKNQIDPKTLTDRLDYSWQTSPTGMEEWGRKREVERREGEGEGERLVQKQNWNFSLGAEIRRCVQTKRRQKKINNLENSSIREYVAR